MQELMATYNRSFVILLAFQYFNQGCKAMLGLAVKNYYKEYKLKLTWGDQDLINVYFHFHPGKKIQSDFMFICIKLFEMIKTH